MAKSESSILAESLCAVSALPRSLVYRNNTGQAWQGRRQKVAAGEYVRVLPGMVILADARPINFGLDGSGDMMGTVEGFAVAGETKTLTGPQRITQKLFQTAWEKAGGIYVLARSPGEMVDGIVQCIKRKQGRNPTGRET